MVCNCPEELQPAAFNMIGKANPAAIVWNHLPEDFLPLYEREFHQVISVQVEEIEGIKIDGYLPVGFSDVLCAREMNSRLDQAEMSLALLIQRHDLAV